MAVVIKIHIYSDSQLHHAGSKNSYCFCTPFDHFYDKRYSSKIHWYNIIGHIMISHYVLIEVVYCHDNILLVKCMESEQIVTSVHYITINFVLMS